MQVCNLHKPFELGVFESDNYLAAEHKNTYFELVFILEGKGIQVINRHKLPYGPDKLFLIFPRDTYGFEIEERTRFFFLRFNESYLRTQSKEWLQKLEYIFHNHTELYTVNSRYTEATLYRRSRYTEDFANSISVIFKIFRYTEFTIKFYITLYRSFLFYRL